jgi:glycosyltransferase involved in cell wall biosynthesis
MKIILFNWRDIKHPKAGGSELYFHEMAKIWIKIGHTVNWISGGWKGCKKEEIVDGISIKRVGNELNLYLFAPFAYFKIKDKPDIIIDVENGLPFFSPLFARSRKVLHIHHFHKDIWFREAIGKSIKEKVIATMGYFLETNIMPLVYNNIKIITLSNSSAKEITNEGFGKVIGIVPPAINIKINPKIKRTKFPSLLFINRIKKYKGADVLIKAFLEICNKEEMKNSILYIAGDGDYLYELKKLAGENERIKFLGYVSAKEKYKLMEKSWIFINPSFKEGWGIVNVEANYFGLPVIGSNVSGIKDSVVGGKTGILFEYGNSRELGSKILDLIKDKKLRGIMGKDAIKWARTFSWESAAREYLKILEEI